jgi:hypothetical protein
VAAPALVAGPGRERAGGLGREALRELTVGGQVRDRLGQSLPAGQDGPAGQDQRPGPDRAGQPPEQGRVTLGRRDRPVRREHPGDPVRPVPPADAVDTQIEFGQPAGLDPVPGFEVGGQRVLP